MTLLHKPITLMPIAVAVTTAISLVACTEEATDNTQTKKVVPSVATVTEDKIAQWRKQAQAGDRNAQYNLAYIYEKGLGVPKDEAKALELYQQAATQGHSTSPNNLGTKKSSK